MQISGIKHLYCSTVLSIIVFSVFTNETLNSFNNSSPLLPHSATVSMNLHTLGTLYKSNCAIFCPFVTGSFHTPCCQGSSMLLHVLEFHSFLMLSNILLHVVFFFFFMFTCSSVDEHLGCFYLFTTVNNDAVNIGIQVSIWVPVFNYFEYIIVLCWISAHLLPAALW